MKQFIAVSRFHTKFMMCVPQNVMWRKEWGTEEYKESYVDHNASIISVAFGKKSEETKPVTQSMLHLFDDNSQSVNQSVSQSMIRQSMIS